MNQKTWICGLKRDPQRLSSSVYLEIMDRNMTIDMKMLSKTVMFFICLILLTSMVLVNDTCFAYILPSEQVIEYMTRNFSKYKTIVIKQRVQQNDESFYTEEIFMKSPDLIDTRVVETDRDRASYTDTTYRSLLMANKSSRIIQIFSMLKINLETVEYDRLDGTIVYRIGDKKPGSPKALIEKKRFLPLLLKYHSPDDPDGGIITIEFKDYRELDKGWFPFEIIYSVGDSILETYSIQTIEANVSIDPSLFLSKEESGSPDSRMKKENPSETEGDRLKQIIKSFEEKYN